VVLTGPALALRYAAAADAPALLELGSDPDVTRFFSWGPYSSVQQPATYIAGLPAERERGERLDFLIVERAEGRPIGVTGLSELGRRDRRAVVGTWLGRRHWGTGANREAKALISHLAFRVLGLERLGAYADLDNPRSQRALTNLGFEREGVLRRWHRHGSAVHDVIVYSWLKEEWECSPLAEIEVRADGEAPTAFVARAESVQAAHLPQAEPSGPVLLPAEAAHRERDPQRRPGGDHAECADVRSDRRALDHRPGEAVD
jgi:ribosomal-protein-alanine N-acetyltransferase